MRHPLPLFSTCACACHASTPLRAAPHSRVTWQRNPCAPGLCYPKEPHLIHDVTARCYTRRTTWGVKGAVRSQERRGRGSRDEQVRGMEQVGRRLEERRVRWKGDESWGMEERGGEWRSGLRREGIHQSRSAAGHKIRGRHRRLSFSLHDQGVHASLHPVRPRHQGRRRSDHRRRWRESAYRDVVSKLLLSPFLMRITRIEPSVRGLTLPHPIP
jgi:hypothetical protein